MEWHKIEDKFPEPEDKIIAQLDGCKITDYCLMTIREGEGLGHIEEWRYAFPDEILLNDLIDKFNEEE